MPAHIFNNPNDRDFAVFAECPLLHRERRDGEVRRIYLIWRDERQIRHPAQEQAIAPAQRQRTVTKDVPGKTEPRADALRGVIDH